MRRNGQLSGFEIFHLCGFKENHNAQYSLLKITGILKQHLDQGNLVCILMDLLKAFDTIKQFNLGKTRSLRLLCKLSQTVTELLK